MKSAALLVIVIALYLVGLEAFASRVAASTPAPTPPVADGVVALTGASTARLTAAIRLLETGRARRALISGVNQKVRRADLRGVTRATRRYYDCCVDLGFTATDTLGNARETAAWARTHQFTSLIVVTSDFHMPRAMIELRAAMPDVRLIAYPVRSEEVDAAHWWRSSASARRLALEFGKYLAILVRQAVLSVGPRESAGAPSVPAPGGKA